MNSELYLDYRMFYFSGPCPLSDRKATSYWDNYPSHIHLHLQILEVPTPAGDQSEDSEGLL